MVGEQNFKNALNIEWFNRHNNRPNIPKSDALAELLSFATYNRCSQRSPCWKVEHELVDLVETFCKGMGWKNVAQKKCAYGIAHTTLEKVGVEAGLIPAPC